MKTILMMTTVSLALVGAWEVIPLALHPVATAQTLEQQDETNQTIYFRTKSYRVQIIWRKGTPYMSVSNNGWQVLVDTPAKIAPKRGDKDPWTTYVAASGDYTAQVRVGPAGQSAIEVSLAGKRVTEETAMFSLPQLAKQAPEVKPRDEVLLAFQTKEYAVRVYRRTGNLFMNLYDRRTAKTQLRQVPVTMTNTTSSLVYRYDGDMSVQARESVEGERSLLIIRDNAIQYRGVGF